MKLLMIRPCEPSVDCWIKGEFLDNMTLVVWSRDDGRAFVYKLSARYVTCCVVFRCYTQTGSYKDVYLESPN